MIGLFLSFLIYISKSISRVLSWIVIYLGYILLYISSHQLRKMTSSLNLPIFRCCSRWGLHWPDMSPYQRWALTSPFHHLLLLSRKLFSVALSLRFPLLAVNQHHCSMEPGLSSRRTLRHLPATIRLTI